MAKFCSDCGKEILTEDKFCINCGKNLNEEEPQKNKKENTEQHPAQDNSSKNTTIQQQETAQVSATQVTTNTTAKYTNGFGIAGFVVSLVSLILCCGSFSWLSLIFSIIGVVNANKNNGEGKGLSIAGIIISSLVVVLVIVFCIICGISASIYESNTSIMG